MSSIRWPKLIFWCIIKILQNFYIALKPGGRLLVMVTNAMRWIRLYTPADVAAGKFDLLLLTEHFEVDYPTVEGVKKLACVHVDMCQPG